MDSNQAMTWNDFSPELLKDLWGWLQPICRKITVEASKLVCVVLLVEDQYGSVTKTEGIETYKDLCDMVVKWQERMRGKCVNYFPVIHKMPEFLPDKGFIEVECFICYESDEEIENKKLYNEILERAKDRGL